MWGLMEDLYIVSNALQRRFTESRLMRLIILLHFIIFWSIWPLKLRFESKTTTKCFWWEHLVILLLLNLTGGCDKSYETNLRGKITSCACFLGSGLNSIFYWLAQWFIFCKSVLSSVTHLSRSRTFEKNVSSAKILHIEVIPSGRSFI